MTVAAQQAVRAWANAQPSLTGEGGALPNGVHLERLRSPAEGPYAVVSRGPAAARGAGVAEDPGAVTVARLAFEVYSASEDVAEKAACAVADAITTLTGNPQRCPGTEVLVLAHDNLAGPDYVPVPAETGDHCFAVTADFVLTSQ